MGDGQQTAPRTGPGLDRAILAAVRERANRDVVAIGDAVGADPVIVDLRCYELQRQGLLRYGGDGGFRLTALGEQHLRNRTGVA